MYNMYSEGIVYLWSVREYPSFAYPDCPVWKIIFHSHHIGILPFYPHSYHTSSNVFSDSDLSLLHKIHNLWYQSLYVFFCSVDQFASYLYFYNHKLDKLEIGNIPLLFMLDKLNKVLPHHCCEDMWRGEVNPTNQLINNAEMGLPFSNKVTCHLIFMTSLMYPASYWLFTIFT